MQRVVSTDRNDQVGAIVRNPGQLTVESRDGCAILGEQADLPVRGKDLAKVSRDVRLATRIDRIVENGVAEKHDMAVRSRHLQYLSHHGPSICAAVGTLGQRKREQPPLEARQ